MNPPLSVEEANVTVAALRLRATILESHMPGVGSAHYGGEWLRHEVDLMTQVADKLEFHAAQEWLDRKAAYDAMQSVDISEAEARALAGDM